ncbi:protein spinster homolog 2 [Lates japonicus]|uniref:Protein spinster homolog 2 n=1 Tax=Lates japonicus TaxID=270547 RepID=A0AAD3NEQ2_LATJO|nr:protein spinster homolog 2 [Lates japonicus]
MATKLGAASLGVLLDIQRHYDVSDSGIGLLQTVFICSFMVAAPIFGYLGDRFNRKVILSCGIFFWSIVTLSSSFISKEYYWLFVLSRGLVGIGESSYSSISPTIIGDLFTNNSRTMMLSVFYLAIPLGSRSHVFSSWHQRGCVPATGAWYGSPTARAQVVQKTQSPAQKRPGSSIDSPISRAITRGPGYWAVIGAATTRLCRQKTERADHQSACQHAARPSHLICLILCLVVIPTREQQCPPRASTISWVMRVRT